MNQHLIVIIIIIALFLYRRVRRNIGWQLLKKKTMWFRIVLFLVIGLLFLMEGSLHLVSFLSDVVGIVAGGILAFYSVNLTVLEEREGRLYYRTNIWIGSIVTGIFLARFIYRFYGIFSGGTIQQGQTNGWQSMYTFGNSWTTGLMLIMFAYYIIYYMILLKKEKQWSKINAN